LISRTIALATKSDSASRRWGQIGLPRWPSIIALRQRMSAGKAWGWKGAPGLVVVARLGFSRAGAGVLVFSKETEDLLAGIG
jgi:hypothetical protein